MAFTVCRGPFHPYSPQYLCPWSTSHLNIPTAPMGYTGMITADIQDSLQQMATATALLRSIVPAG